MPDLPTDPDDPSLNGWYHTIELGNGLVSQGFFDHRPVIDRYGIPESLRGKKVLDVATGDGFFAFEMERRGAERVVAIDVPRIGDCDWLPRMKTRIGDTANDHTWPIHFAMAHAMLNSSVEYKFCSVYDLSPYTVGIFDLVFCGSLLLHLQNPLGALHAIRSVTRDMAIIETTIDRSLEEAVPGRPVMTFGSPENEAQPGENNTYWLCTTAAIQKMLRYADFPVTTIHGIFDLPPTTLRGASVVARTWKSD